MRHLQKAEANAFNLEIPGAFLVYEVAPGSPAARAGGLPLAGVLARDLLIAVNDHPVGTVDDVHRGLAGVQAGDPIAIRVLRGTKPAIRKRVPGAGSLSPAGGSYA